MARVRRNGPNTLVFRKVTIRFRRHPGTDPEGALGRIPYVIRAGLAAAGGLTRPNGDVTLRLPPEGTIRLEIFGSAFDIATAAPPPPAATPEGAGRRLAMLGYRPETEAAVLDFQADHGLEPKGLDPAGGLDAAAQARLESETGC